MKKLWPACLLFTALLGAQNFTRIDTLKGSNTEFRNFWDVKKYDITVEPKYADSTVSGSNKISFEILQDAINPVFQIDLQQPMNYKIIDADAKLCSSRREGDFIFIETNRHYKKGENHTFTIQFYGKPTVAKNAPWDGGWIFTRDKTANPWMSVAQEGIGASVWLPLKDLWSDEPDNGITLKIITPSDLVGVGNGRLIDQVRGKEKNTFTWEVKNPINAYSIAPNVGKYINFKDTFSGENGPLDLDYWVLDYNLERAKKQFAQVKPMLKAFEYWFGPYPFYEDSYKLVESPYLGMEHQSSVAYGNNFENGYLGRDLSGSGAGLGWDFIIVHESGHEWFANNITAKEKADMWIHEGFTSYSETLFTEAYIDKNAAEEYVVGIRNNIRNDEPIIGTYGITKSGSGDMYYKGANMLHTIRQVINDDHVFRGILRGLNSEFYHQTVTTQQVEHYMSQKAAIDLSTIFDQYLRTTKIPTLEYRQAGNKFQYRYTNIVKNLKLPLRINQTLEIYPTTEWKTLVLDSPAPVRLDRNYYINYKPHVME